MKKVGIVTLNGYFNYGNRLQNYALQETLKTLNYNVETLLVEDNKSNKVNKVEKFNVVQFSKKVVNKILFLPRRRIDAKYKNNRTNRFVEFSNKYIKESDYLISEESIHEKTIGTFDYFVAGSDQVWNPEYNSQPSVYFLSFAPEHKRISYAASFGISELPNECVPNYKKWLYEITHLSVREEAGANIIRDLTGREAEVVLDPTLLLSKKQWLLISKESSNKPKNKYLLTYFLGSVSQQNEIKIKKIAKEKDLEIVHLANIKDKKAYIADPSEFIDYINSADMFLTDSFHGSVFSILFEKPFVVFEREGSEKAMNSRIDTLLSTFNLNDRNWVNISSAEDIYDVDYSHISTVLELKRKKSLLFLKRSFGLSE